jgi:heme-degrading monooxygenase HmoA
MFHVLARVSIEDFTKFIGVFTTRGAEMRRKHGNRRSWLFRVAGEPQQVVAIFEWESRQAFEGFLADPQVKETMKLSGTASPPDFTYLEPVAELPS